MPKVALIFPGQGSQTVGMGKSVYNEMTPEIIERINEKFDIPLLDIMFNGPIEKLNQTKYTQPAIFIVSVTLLHTLEKFCKEAFWKNVVCVAGHSVGEYSALVASGCLQLESALELVRIRAIAMEEASPKDDQNTSLGSMSAILGCDKKIIEEIIVEHCSSNTKRCTIANYNCPGQIVITGLLDDVETVCSRALECGAKKCVKLNVSGPFHSQWMETASKRLKEAIEDITFATCKVPVISNVTAHAMTTAEDFKRLLPIQVTSPVMWNECMDTMVKMGVDTFVEIGSGKVLSGISKHCATDKRFISIQTAEDIFLYEHDAFV
ncbi:MAG: ACP S-malonyltransferase [Holosporales bacterium]|jgi:[acyl-carrier-protein] S-malonyltransferase|nr:ACP S-malonyltransferase [Holosporales bacterium]